MFSYMYNIAVDETITIFESLIHVSKVGVSVDQGMVTVQYYDESGESNTHQVKAGSGIVIYAKMVSLRGDLGSSGMFIVE